MKNLCAIPGCNKFVFGHGFCSAHYSRWRRHGDPLAGRTTPGTPVELRLWPFIKRGDPDQCWEWQGPRDKAGYGWLKINGTTISAYRLAYQLLTKTIVPTGLTMDHLCRNPPCCNPKHLQPVPERTNLLRGTGTSAQNARKHQCPAGHPYDLLNTRFNNRGERCCRTCTAAQSRAYYAYHKKSHQML